MKNILKVVLVIIGTLIGAGFASGKEVYVFFNKYGSCGLYGMILSGIILSLVIYKVPSRTGVDISVETILKLSKIENIIAIKEANPSLEKICNIILATKEENFSVLSGNDNLLLPILSVGGKGVISVAANILPDQMHNICQNNDKNLDE